MSSGGYMLAQWAVYIQWLLVWKFNSTVDTQWSIDPFWENSVPYYHNRHWLQYSVHDVINRAIWENYVGDIWENNVGNFAKTIVGDICEYPY